MVWPGSCGMEGGQCSRQTSRGLQHRPALPPDPNTHDCLEESTDRHPLFGSPAAPPPPWDRGALPKLRVPLCPRARAHHPHPLPLTHTAGPEMTLSFFTSRNITLKPHPAPGYLLAAPRPPPWLPESLQTPRASCAPSCKTAAPRPARRQTPYLGGLHFRSRRHLQVLLGYPEEQQHRDPEHPEDRQHQAARQAPHGPL